MKKVLWLLIVLGLVSMTGYVSAESGSCSNPFPWEVSQCQEMEQAILGATVRVAFHGYVEIETGYEMQRIKGTLSHATVVGGRYLISHHHFGLPLSQLLLYSQYANGGFTGVSVYRLDGSTVLENGPISSFSVVAEEGQTTILDFGEEKGQGFFDRRGVVSAKMATEGRLGLEPGMEVAQIDWDAEGRTHVIWTEIESVYVEEGLPLMRVNHFIRLGSSGGGVFLNGVHVGNNWGRLLEPVPGTGEIVRQHSLVALNSFVVGPGQ